MPANKQYEIDPERAEFNRLEKLKRRTNKWKQLELLERIQKHEESFLSSSIFKYNKIKERAADEEVAKLAETYAKRASGKSREALERRFSRKVVYAHTESLISSKIEEGKLSIDSNTYSLLKDDISRKGILIPLLITDSGEIIDGYQRFHIAKELELELVPCMIVYLKSLPEHQQYQLLTELRFSCNVGRRHCPSAEKRKLNKIWKTISSGFSRRGRPTHKEINLRDALNIKDISELPELDRHLVRLYGIRKEKK